MTADSLARLSTDDIALLATEALADDRAATPAPWRISMSGYSVKSLDDGMPIVCAVAGGATAREEDVAAWLDNAAFIAAARTREPLLAAGYLDLTRQLAEANRELERWRHGVTIEGDFVCLDSLALSEARAELRAVGKAKP